MNKFWTKYKWIKYVRYLNNQLHLTRNVKLCNLVMFNYHPGFRLTHRFELFIFHDKKVCKYVTQPFQSISFHDIRHLNTTDSISIEIIRFRYVSFPMIVVKVYCNQKIIEKWIKHERRFAQRIEDHDSEG